MKILLILAHPKEDSLNANIAVKLKDKLCSAGNDVVFLNLYSEEDMLPFYSLSPHHEIPKIVRHQEQIKWADHMVFVFPIWWSGPPAIVKNYFDSVYSSHFAYKYINKVPVGLLKGKNATFISTSGGPAYYYTNFFSPFRFMWRFMILGFCGVKLKNLFILPNVNIQKPTDEIINKFVEKCIKQIK